MLFLAMRFIANEHAFHWRNRGKRGRYRKAHCGEASHKKGHMSGILTAVQPIFDHSCPSGTDLSNLYGFVLLATFVDGNPVEATAGSWQAVAACM